MGQRIRIALWSRRTAACSRAVGMRLAALVLGLFPLFASAQVVNLTDLNTTQIARLDRSKTVVLMPGGVIEQHGPYLPAFTDGFMNAWWTERLAEALVQEGWTVVVFPMIPLGDGGANEIGRKYQFPGSYGVRVATERAVYMDLGTELGEQGFRWIFLIHNHGSPIHNLVLDQAGDFFHDTYGGQMVNLTGLAPKSDTPPPLLDDAARALNGIDVHAGLSEASRIMFLHPALVDPAIAQAAPYTARSGQELVEIAKRDGWPGYFGAPHLATPQYGAKVMQYRLELLVQVAREILAGKDPRSIPRYATEAMKREKDTMDASLAYDERVRRRQEAWLTKNGIR